MNNIPHIVDSGASVMNNQPVAWMEDDVLPLTHIIKAVVRREQDEQYTIPLYTHPHSDKSVKAKTLTDEEYEKLMQQWDYWRKQIADGDKSSAPRDWFESVIDYLLEQY